MLHAILQIKLYLIAIAKLALFIIKKKCSIIVSCALLFLDSSTVLSKWAVGNTAATFYLNYGYIKTGISNFAITKKNVLFQKWLHEDFPYFKIISDSY